MEATTEIVPVYSNVSDWLTRLDEFWRGAVQAGWDFLFCLRDGIDQFGRTDPAKMELYELAATQLGLAVRTLQNYVSTARNAVAQVAYELGLDYQHAVIARSLGDIEEATDLLHRAAEQQWTPARTSKEVFGTHNFVRVEPSRLARTLMDRYGVEFCRQLAAEWMTMEV